MTVRVIVCGGREYDEAATVRQVLRLFDPTQVTIVHGDARGADRLAATIATELGFEVEAHPADWRKHGRGAGPIRNQAMLDAGAVIVVAFPGGAGTADMVRRAARAGVAVVNVRATRPLGA